MVEEVKYLLALVLLTGCTDPAKKAAYLDEIAGLGSLALANPTLTDGERIETRKAIDNTIADGEAHYK